jgi:hypothetical protein
LLHNSPTACTPNGTRTQTMLPVIFFSNSKSPPSPPGPRPGASRIGARCKSFVMQGMCFAACMVATCTPNVNGSRTHNTNVNTQLQHMYMQTRSIATLPYDVCQLAIRDALPSSPRPDRKHHTGTSRRTSLFHLHPLDVRWCCLWWRWKRGRSYASNRQLIGRKQLQTTDMHGAPFPPPPGAHAHEHTHAHVRHTSLKQCSTGCTWQHNAFLLGMGGGKYW